MTGVQTCALPISLVTSIMGGPLLQRLLNRAKRRRLSEYILPKAFLPRLVADSRRDAIAVLSRCIASAHNLNATMIEDAVWKREAAMPTGLSDGVAVPHARIAGIRAPIVAVGLSESGVEFGASDGEPARIVVLLLTPIDSDAVQLAVMGETARTFQNAEVRQAAVRSQSYTEFVATLREAGTEKRSAMTAG